MALWVGRYALVAQLVEQLRLGRCMSPVRVRARACTSADRADSRKDGKSGITHWAGMPERPVNRVAVNG